MLQLYKGYKGLLQVITQASTILVLRDTGFEDLGAVCEDFRWTPNPLILTIRDNTDHIRVLLYSCFTALTGWRGGVLLMKTVFLNALFCPAGKAAPIPGMVLYWLGC